MSKCFKKGFIYVFSKEKFIKYEGYKEYMNILTKPWVDECDGMTIEYLDHKNGLIKTGEEPYRVNPEWCKCIGRGY